MILFLRFVLTRFIYEFGFNRRTHGEKNILNLEISTKLTSGFPEIRLRTEEK